MRGKDSASRSSNSVGSSTKTTGNGSTSSGTSSSTPNSSSNGNSAVSAKPSSGLARILGGAVLLAAVLLASSAAALYRSRGGQGEGGAGSRFHALRNRADRADRAADQSHGLAKWMARTAPTTTLSALSTLSATTPTTGIDTDVAKLIVKATDAGGSSTNTGGNSNSSTNSNSNGSTNSNSRSRSTIRNNNREKHVSVPSALKEVHSDEDLRTNRAEKAGSHVPASIHNGAQIRGATQASAHPTNRRKQDASAQATKPTPQETAARGVVSHAVDSGKHKKHTKNSVGGPGSSKKGNFAVLKKAPRKHPAVPVEDFEPLPPLRTASQLTAEESAALNDFSGMTCQSSHEPTCSMDPYVRFWNKRFFKEDCYFCPLRHPKRMRARASELKYVVFMPDQGGWNNIRMAAETAIILAHVTGRVLVLPPKSTFYLLDKNKRREDNESTFSKFFDLLKMREGMEIISMEDFLATTARMGLLKQEYPKHIPVSNFAVNSARLWQYLEKASTVREWEPGKMFFGFDIQGGYNGTFVVDDPTQAAAAMPATFGSFNGTSTNDRYKAMVAHGRKMLPYGEALHKEKVLYFPGDYRHTHRILTHFYTYLYWHNPHLEHIYRRIVRDRLRYHDDIFCVAGKIVRTILEDSAKIPAVSLAELAGINIPMKEVFGNVDETMNSRQTVQGFEMSHPLTLGGNTNYNSTYFAFHIRRGDFQYKQTRLSAEHIWNATKHLLDPTVSRLIYIATDERDKSFFAPFFNSVYQVKFLPEYEARLGIFRGESEKQQVSNAGVWRTAKEAAAMRTVRAASDIKVDEAQPKMNRNHVGMVEQVICANAHTFIGTPFSTFTGYITRMRGYYRDGRYERTFYTLDKAMYQIQKKRRIEGPFWAKEFQTAHYDIDDFY